LNLLDVFEFVAVGLSSRRIVDFAEVCYKGNKKNQKKIGFFGLLLMMRFFFRLIIRRLVVVVRRSRRGLDGCGCVGVGESGG
jgi:hypothetical protein